MAKVYEALQRAEEARRRQQGDDSAPAVPLEWEPAGPAAPSRRTRFWKRWLGRERSRRGASDASSINKQRIALLQPDSYVAEQFRALRVRIDAIAAQRPVRTIVITSPSPGEGKTTAAVNLATVTALSVGRRVLLMDCDLRRPRVHKALGLRPEVGLAEVLTDAAGLDDAIMKVEGVNLEVLAVRGKPVNPSELLGSSNMRKLIEEVAQRFDRVIIDTPAVIGLPDAKTVSEFCDGLVMVVRADVTAQQDIQATLEILDRRRVLGLLLNGAKVERGRYGYAG